LNRFLLDTNIVSELRKPKPHGAVMSWFSGLAPDQIWISAVVLGELQAGVEITRAQDAQRAREIEDWIDRIAATYSVLAMDGSCFREHARLMRGQSDSLREDAMIAATARVHGLTVVTRNERDFRWFSVPVFNPFRS
jgi:hypothetical protein